MIRLPETRAHRRASGALVKYLAQPMTLGRSEVADAVAQHLGVLLEENARLRAQLLRVREETAARDEAITMVRHEIAVHLGRLA